MNLSRFQAVLLYARKRRRARRTAVESITGTPPSLGTLSAGSALSSAVTFGTYQGSPTVTRQMRLGQGEWLTYVGATTVSLSQVWRVREVVVLNGVTRIFTSNSQQVT